MKLNLDGVQKVLIYIRESTEEQMTHGYRPEVQKQKIREYCKKHQFEIVKEYQEPGGGKSEKHRPEFRKMIDFAKSRNDIRFIVFKDTSRFYRDSAGGLGVWAELEEKQIYMLSTQVDYSPRDMFDHRGKINPAMYKNRLDALTSAEYENNTRGHDISEGILGKAKEGKATGMLPYGVRWVDDLKQFVGFDKIEAKVVKEIFRLYATGEHSYKSISSYLNWELGIKKKKAVKRKVKHGNREMLKTVMIDAEFKPDLIRDILKNNTYIGYRNTQPFGRLRTMDSEGVEKDLAPLINEDDFNYVQEIIASRNKGGGGNQQKNTYLIQGIGFSAENNEKLNCQPPNQKSSKRYYYPRKNTRDDGGTISMMPADQVEEALITLLVHVKINSLDSIANRLKAVVRSEAEQFINPIKANEILIGLRKDEKALTEMLERSRSKQVELLLEQVQLSISQEESNNPASVKVIKHDFNELRSVLSDIHSSFLKLKSLGAKKELLEILFKELFVGQRKYDEKSPAEKIGKGKGKNLLGDRSKPLHEEAKELKALLQKLTPALFEEIYVKSNKEVIELTVKPTGLFMLLTDKEEEPVEERGTSKKNS